MSYVLEQTKQRQVLALAQLGWTVSRIAAAVHVDRATVTRYMRTAGLPVRGRGRPSDPDRKGKVEAGVGHAQKKSHKGLRFETLDAAQAYLDRWETHWTDTRIHGTTKRQVAEMFAEERAALGPLPLEPFRYYRFGARRRRRPWCTPQAPSPTSPRRPRKIGFL